MPDQTHPRPCVCPYSRVRASAGQGLGIRSERPWALVRLNATTSPYHSFDRGRDAPHASRRTPDTQVQYPILHVHPKPSLWQTAGRARPRLFQLALCVRLGVPLAELGVDGEVVVCKGYGAGHDRYGRHPSSCTKGNRSSLWTDYHDGLHVVCTCDGSGGRDARANSLGVRIHRSKSCVRTLCACITMGWGGICSSMWR